jgi:hypothetical protein
MRTLAKILRTIGGRLTWPTGQYAGPGRLGPWRSFYYRYPSRSDGRR